MRIGIFRAADGGYNGQLRTLSLSIEISLEAASQACRQAVAPANAV